MKKEDVYEIMMDIVWWRFIVQCVMVGAGIVGIVLGVLLWIGFGD